MWLALVIPFGIFYAMAYGPEAALFAELFDANVRYTGISFVYQVSGIFASGHADRRDRVVARERRAPWLVGVYVMLSALLSIVSARAIEKRGGVDGVAVRAM